MCSGLDTVPTVKLLNTCAPDHAFGTWQLQVSHRLIACLPVSVTRLSIVSSVIFFFFLSVYGIKAASNSDLLIRSTQLKLTCRSLAMCTRDGKLGFINTQKTWIYKYAGYTK